MQHITRFLLELGAGFAYVGRQVPLEVGGEDFFLDLLFYHLKLRCSVVIELKAGVLTDGHKCRIRCTAVSFRPLGGQGAVRAWGHHTKSIPRGLPRRRWLAKERIDAAVLHRPLLRRAIQHFASSDCWPLPWSGAVCAPAIPSAPCTSPKVIWRSATATAPPATAAC
ncbi:MAG: PDDEXK nuclease domain-containing protein [Synechococcus sp.]|nr:PDDEXK nuclease domain-containing protein [Synechococcus sp.]